MIQMPFKQRFGEGMLEVAKIRTDGGTQPREGIDENIAKEYGQEMTANGIAVFDPVTIFYDGDDYWLADGFHRVTGAKMFNIQNIRTDIRQGTRRDAVLYSAGANAKHGLRRTNADKRRSVMTLLEDNEWRRWSDREIARRCGVDHHLVGDLRQTRQDSEPTGHDPQSTLRIGGDGRTIDTANIGKPKLSKCDNCGNEVETVYRDTRKNRWLCADCEAARAAEVLEEMNQRRAAIPLVVGKWYPVHHNSQSILDDPFESQKAGSSDPRYSRGYAIQNASLIIAGIMADGNYARYKIVPPAPPVPDGQPESLDAASNDPAPTEPEPPSAPQSELPEAAPALKYQPGMMATCRHCLNLGFDPASHTTWTPSGKPGIWICPQGHRLADSLLIIVAQPDSPQGEPPLAAEPTSEEGLPHPLPPSPAGETEPKADDVDEPFDDEAEDPRAAAFLSLNSTLQVWYDQVKLHSRRAARRIMRIGYDHSAEAAREAALACMDVMKGNEKAQRDLKTVRQEIEMLRRVMKEHRVPLPGYLAPVSHKS